MCVVNILNSVNATPTVKTVLNNGKQIWKPKGKLSNNSLNKIQAGLESNRPTRKKFALGRTGHPLVSGLGLFKTYDGESFKAQELCGKVHRGNFVILILKWPSRKHTCFVRDIKGTDILK
ncbi:hypothetical protein Tco_0147939, partial [Tanacetum coccineum]